MAVRSLGGGNTSSPSSDELVQTGHRWKGHAGATRLYTEVMTLNRVRDAETRWIETAIPSRPARVRGTADNFSSLVIRDQG